MFVVDVLVTFYREPEFFEREPDTGRISSTEVDIEQFVGIAGSFGWRPCGTEPIALCGRLPSSAVLDDCSRKIVRHHGHVI